MLTQDKKIILLLKNKPRNDIIREYLIHLGFDKKKEYLSKITVVQPFSIREKVARISQPPKKDPYK